MASPFERLPNELLINIFEQAEISSRSLVEDVEAPQALPIRLTHVCRLWRHVAVNVPTLWNHIPYNLFYLDPYFDLYIERSGSCLLDIQCDLSLYDPSCQVKTVNMLLPHVERLRSLEITLPFVDCSSLMRDIYLPRLETLALYGTIFVGRVELANPLFVDGAPQLRKVELVDTICPASAAFNNLTTLVWTMTHNTFFIPSQVRELLGHISHCLVYLSMSSHAPQILLNRQDFPKVELPALRVLHVSNYPILTSLSAPNLTILSLSLSHITALETFVNSAPHYHLEKLVLRNMDLSPFDHAFNFILDHSRLESIAILSCKNEDGLWNLLRNSNIREVATTPRLSPDIILNWSLVQSALSDRVANGCGSISRVGFCKRDRDRVPFSFVRWLSDNNIQMQFYDEPFPVLSFDPREGVVWWQ